MQQSETVDEGRSGERKRGVGWRLQKDCLPQLHASSNIVIRLPRIFILLFFFSFPLILISDAFEGIDIILINNNNHALFKIFRIVKSVEGKIKILIFIVVRLAPLISVIFLATYYGAVVIVSTSYIA